MSPTLSRIELDRGSWTEETGEAPPVETARPALAGVAVAFTAATAVVLSVPLSALLSHDYALAVVGGVISVSLAAVTGAVAAAAWWYALRG